MNDKSLNILVSVEPKGILVSIIGGLLNTNLPFSLSPINKSKVFILTFSSNKNLCIKSGPIDLHSGVFVSSPLHTCSRFISSLLLSLRKRGISVSGSPLSNVPIKLKRIICENILTSHFILSPPTKSCILSKNKYINHFISLKPSNPISLASPIFDSPPPPPSSFSRGFWATITSSFNLLSISKFIPKNLLSIFFKKFPYNLNLPIPFFNGLCFRNTSFAIKGIFLSESSFASSLLSHSKKSVLFLLLLSPAFASPPPPPSSSAVAAVAAVASS